MEDLLWFSEENKFRGQYLHLHGFGHYREEYIRTSVGWRIKSFQLTRIRVELS
jgi:hypothetical protein